MPSIRLLDQETVSGVSNATDRLRVLYEDPLLSYEETLGRAEPSHEPSAAEPTSGDDYDDYEYPDDFETEIDSRQLPDSVSLDETLDLGDDVSASQDLDAVIRKINRDAKKVHTGARAFEHVL